MLRHIDRATGRRRESLGEVIRKSLDILAALEDDVPVLLYTQILLVLRGAVTTRGGA